MSGTRKYPYDSRHIADWFLAHANEQGDYLPLTKLLKLVYLAHGWCLAVLDRPLIYDRIETWDYGPVIPAVYHAFRTHNGLNLEKWEQYVPRDVEEPVQSLLVNVYRMYRDQSSRQLSDLTHMPEGPWASTMRKHGRFHLIPDDEIKKHYIGKLERSANE